MPTQIACLPKLFKELLEPFVQEKLQIIANFFLTCQHLFLFNLKKLSTLNSLLFFPANQNLIVTILFQLVAVKR